MVEASRDDEDEEEERLLPKELARLMAIVCSSAGCAGAGDEEGEEGMAVPSSSPFPVAGMDMDRTWEDCPSSASPSSSCDGDVGPCPSDTEEAEEDGPIDSSTIRRPLLPPPPPPAMGDRGEGAGATAADPPPPNPNPAASVADSERLPRLCPPWGPMDAESAARTSSTSWAVKEPEREWRRPCQLALSPSLAYMCWMVVIYAVVCGVGYAMRICGTQFGPRVLYWGIYEPPKNRNALLASDRGGGPSVCSRSTSSASAARNTACMPFSTPEAVTVGSVGAGGFAVAVVGE